MNFSREFTRIEYFFLVSFLVLYLFYFYKVFSAARKLKTSATSSVIKFLVRSLYLGLMSLAALGPNFGVTETEARASGKDIFFAFDLSESMNANDVEPSRLDRAKNEVLELLGRFKTDRLGLILFNSNAYVETPLTFDQENVRSSIAALKTSMLAPGSTDFNPVVELLYEKLSQGAQNRGKVGVIITDGEAHYPLHDDLVQALKGQNIQIFWVTVGTLSGGKIPQGERFKVDQDGQTVQTTLEVQAVSSFAKASNGDYFLLNNAQNSFPDLAQKMSLVSSAPDEVSRQSVTYNKYVFFLLLALVFVGVDFLITVKVLKI